MFPEFESITKVTTPGIHNDIKDSFFQASLPGCLFLFLLPRRPELMTMFGLQRIHCGTSALIQDDCLSLRPCWPGCAGSEAVISSINFLINVMHFTSAVLSDKCDTFLILKT